MKAELGKGTGNTLSIVHLCAPAEVGGLERVVQGLAVGSLKAGHEVRVVAVVEPGADLEGFHEPLLEAGVECIRLEVNSRAYLSERRQVRSVLQELSPDVLHTHGYRADILDAGVARTLGIATVSTLHGSSRMGGRTHVFEWIQERVLRRFDGVIPVSRPLHSLLQDRGVPADRLHLIPNALEEAVPRYDADELPSGLSRASPAGVTRIGFVGRLIPIKGADRFLDALSLLESTEWEAVVVGDGPERTNLERRAHELGLAESVRFLGAVPNAARLMEFFDLFVLSSRSEGTPMVVLEAMRAGLPIVASSVGGVPDVLTRGTAWLPPPDDVSALARDIDAALGQPDEAARKGDAARQGFMAEYSADQWIRRHEAAYHAACRVAALRAGSEK